MSARAKFSLSARASAAASTVVSAVASTAASTVVGAVAGGLVLLGAVLPVCAADWSFDPVLSVSARHTNNAEQFDREVSEGDDLVSADLSLVLAATTPRARFQVSWLPSYDWYRDNSSFDSYAHNVGLSWGFQPTQRVRWELSGGWTRTERARLYQQTIDQPTASVPGRENQTGYARFGGSFQLSPRVTLRAAVGGQQTKIDVFIPNTDEGDAVDTDGDGTPDFIAPLGVIDNKSTQADVLVGLSRTISPLASLGAEYRGSRIDEGVFGVRDVHRGVVTWQYGALERIQWTVTAGAAKTNVRELASENLRQLPPGADPAQLEDTGDEPTEAIGSILVSGTPSLRTRVAAGLARDVGSSSGLSGASVTDTLYADFSYLVGRFSTLSVRGRIARFEPLRFTSTSRRTRNSGVSAEYAWALSPRWYLVFGAEAYSQANSGAAADESLSILPTPDLQYAIFSAGVRWSPTARPRPGLATGHGAGPGAGPGAGTRGGSTNEDRR